MLKALVALLLVMCLVLPVFAEGGKEGSGKAVPIEIWYGAAVTEAGPPPADWVVYKIVKEKLGIDLKLTAVPSNPNDQDVKINAAGAANALPDLFMVNRPVWLNLVKNGLVADSWDDVRAMLINQIAEVTKTGDFVIQVKCSSKELYDEAVNKLFSATEKQAIKIFEEALPSAARKYDCGAVNYSQDKTSRVIKLFLDYKE